MRIVVGEDYYIKLHVHFSRGGQSKAQGTNGAFLKETFKTIEYMRTHVCVCMHTYSDAINVAYNMHILYSSSTMRRCQNKWSQVEQIIFPCLVCRATMKPNDYHLFPVTLRQITAHTDRAFDIPTHYTIHVYTTHYLHMCTCMY